MDSKLKKKIILGLFMLCFVVLGTSSTYGYIRYQIQLDNLSDYSSTSTTITGEDDVNDVVYDYVEYDTMKLINYDELDELLPEDELFLLISSNTCIYCNELKETLNDVLIDLKKEIYVIEVNDLDDFDKDVLANRFSIDSVPTLLRITGNEVDSGLIGLKTEEHLYDWFELVED